MICVYQQNSVSNSISTEETNAVPTNVTSTVLMFANVTTYY